MNTSVSVVHVEVEAGLLHLYQAVYCQNALLHCRVKRLCKSGNVIFIIMVNGLKQRNDILLQDILYLQIIREAIMLNLIF